jgi:xanthine dehydrogenase accessory factor
MHADLLRLAADLARREEPFVLAVVVRRQPASSSQQGDMALVTATGEFHGWLGGSCTQPTVVREARRALADGKPQLIALSPDAGSGDQPARPGLVSLPMTCQSGGSVEIYLEPILPAPRLTLFGISPTARALAKLGRAMGYTVVAVVPPAEVDPARFPDAHQVIADSAPPERREPPENAAGAAGAVTPATPRFAVVATMGDDDERSIRTALASAPDYLGVVASAKRFAQIRGMLLEQGVDAAALDAIRSPAGVAIGAQTPEEIAVSVLAEIVAWRRRGNPAIPSVPVITPTEALDPVCGMTVAVAGARHTAQHAGQTFYFCCGGCRERFAADPERYT